MAHWLNELAPEKTIKTWFDAFVADKSGSLPDVVSTPPQVAEEVAHHGGRLHLIASHLDLIEIDFSLAAKLSNGWKPEHFRDNYLRVHRFLTEAFARAELRPYDFILIDCAPNFGVVTRTAIVASDHVLIPAK
jgi:chromosome partitioning protein